MSVLLTGATGYLGSYVAAKLLRRRIDIVRGDLTQPRLGLTSADRGRCIEQIDSVIHCAASLNRKSAKECFNVNLRGTLAVIRLARDAHDDHGLRRLSDVSTTAVVGRRQGEVVDEDHAAEWNRSDYDPYARTRSAPRLQRAAAGLVELGAAGPRAWPLTRAMSLLKVFWPYLVHDTVFDNRRVTTEIGEGPVSSTEYAYGLMRFATSTGFRYPHRSWPGER